MKAVKLWGGLGNQLFQYAFGRYLSEKYGFDVRYYPHVGVSSNELAINELVKGVPFLSEKERKSVGCLYRSLLHYRISRKMAKTFPFLVPKLYVESNLSFHVNFPKSVVLFDGYWQSYKYIEGTETQIKDILSYKNINMLSVIHEIQESNSVFVHIRRGDYLNGKNHVLFEECKMDYYKNAIDIISRSVDCPKYFIFSNDMNWVKANLNFTGLSVSFVENESSMMDFVCMKSCKHAIIANSTFSWWAAWLINNTTKIVVAPRKWYRNEKMNQTTSDMIPDEWIRI